MRLEVNQRLRLDLKLQPSAVSAEVVVRQSMPLLDTDSSPVGQVIDARHISQLPLNGRQFLELALLVPGAHASHGASTGSTLPLYWRPGQNSAISITGGRPGANAFRIDGTTNTDPSFNTYIVNLPPDAIREFQLETASYSAELGAAGFGAVEVHEHALGGGTITAAALWNKFSRGGAPAVLMRRKMGEAAFAAFSERIVRRLEQSLGVAPFEERLLALLGVGSR